MLEESEIKSPFKSFGLNNWKNNIASRIYWEVRASTRRFLLKAAVLPEVSNYLFHEQFQAELKNIGL